MRQGEAVAPIPTPGWRPRRLASSVFSTWLPIVPILGVGLPLGLLGKVAVGESFLIGVPLVAISMGVETALLDAVLFRMLLKESGKKRFMPLLIANILNASIALVNCSALLPLGSK